jgi:predicted CopG family antitoxin
MHGYKVPLKDMTKEEQWEILHELLEKKKENIQKQKEIIKKIEEELHKKKMKITREEEKLKHYRHLLNKIL